MEFEKKKWISKERYSIKRPRPVESLEKAKIHP